MASAVHVQRYAQVVALSYPDPPLTDGVALLRPWVMGDLPCVEEASRDPYIPEWTTVPSLYTEPEGRAWIERQWGRAANGEGLAFAITDAASGEALGGVFLILRPQPGVVGIGYWLIEPARGRRLASRAVNLLAPWALREAGLARVEALVEPDNVASQRVLERAAFQREGYLRAYLSYASRRVDVVIYSLLQTDLS